MELVKISDFLSQEKIGIVGISETKSKFGNGIYKMLKKKKYNVLPVHHQMKDFTGDLCYPSIDALPEDVNALLVCTSPDKTLKAVDQAYDKGIKQIWVQQGGESKELLDKYNNKDVNLIHNECIFMFAEPVGFLHKFHRGINKLAGKYPS